MRFQAKVWMDGRYRGTYDLFPIFNVDGTTTHALVAIGALTFVARSLSADEFEALFAVVALDDTLDALHRDRDALAAGPITLALPSCGRGPTPDSDAKPEKR